MKCITQSLSLVFLLAGIFFGIVETKTAYGRPPTEAEFAAAGSLAEDIAEWLRVLPQRPKSISIFSTYAHDPLEQDYSEAFENLLLKHLGQLDFDQVNSCYECRSPQIQVEGEALYIRKGAPDAETLKRLGERHPVEAYLLVELFKTKFSVIAQVSLIQTNTGNLLGLEKFSATALTVFDNEVQLLLTLGVGKELGSGTATSNFAYAGNIMLLEELGFGKGGLSIGATLTSTTIIYVTPTIAFYGDVARRRVNWSLNLGAGFGLAGATKGFVGRAGLEFFIGSFTIVGGEVVYLLPESSTPMNNIYVGGHLGISFGR